MSIEANPEKPKKKRHIVLTVLLVLTALIAAAAAATAVLWFSGKEEVEQEPVKVIVLPDLEPEPEASGEAPEQVSAPEVHDEILEEYTMRRGGKLYRQKKNIQTYLALGIDRNTTDNLGYTEFRTDAHADLIMLAVLDLEAKKTTFLSLPRDTMAEIDTYDKDGNPTGAAIGQIALSYRYGDGGPESNRLTADAVSRLLYNITIHGTASLFLDGIGAINDAVGGVTLTPIVTTGSLQEGVEVTLTGAQAEEYVRHREYTAYGNLERMELQKQYFKAFLRQAVTKAKEAPSNILKMYHAVSDYVVTDLTVNEITYLASQAIGTAISGEIRTIPGEIILASDGYVQYILDEKAVADLITELYFEEIEA